jgi:hypothetical protein
MDSIIGLAKYDTSTGGFTLQRRGSNQGAFPAEILYGAYPNLQLSVAPPWQPIRGTSTTVRSPGISR